LKNYTLKAEAISKTENGYTHVLKYVDKKGNNLLKSELITLERYLELYDKFGMTTAYVY